MAKLPQSIKSILMEIVDRIRNKNNETGSESIPSSDDISRRLLGDMGLSKEDTEKYLNMLIDSHYIFSFKIVEGNEKMKEKPVFGYVIAEHGIVSSNKEKVKRDIESIYEGQTYKRKPSGEVVKEVLSQGRHNNTPLGKAVNASIMLQQYENILRGEAAEEYTESWKIGQLNDILELNEKKKAEENTSAAAPEGQTAVSNADQNVPVQEKTEETSGVDIDLGDEYGYSGQASAQTVSAGAPPSQPSASAMRAVDSPSAQELENVNLSGAWGQAVQKFGIEFLLRIHFRKYEFDTVIGLVKTKKIAKESDIRYIRDTMRKLNERMDVDPNLKMYKTKIDELKRITQIKLNDIFMAKKQA